MAIAMLSGDSGSLLCKRPECAICAISRKFTADQSE